VLSGIRDQEFFIAFKLRFIIIDTYDTKVDLYTKVGKLFE